jgi:hypothetical protein
MKIFPLALCLMICPALAQAMQDPLCVELRTGEKLTVTKISKVEPDGITVWTDAGVRKIPVAGLAKAELSRFSLDEKTAQEHAAAVAKQEAAYAKQRAQTTKHEPKEPSSAKFITANQVKTMWVNNLPAPRSLDPDYWKIMESYKKFVAEIRAGKRDLEAQETAAIYNKAKAIEIGDIDLASTYEAELGRISEAKTAAEALAAQKRQAQREANEFFRLESQLRSIDTSIRSMTNALR